MDITMEATQRLLGDELLNELLRQVARGNETAFTELYDRTCHMVSWFVLRVLREEATTQETVQEIYVQVWQKAKSFDQARGRGINWILTIARNRAIDNLRSCRLRVEHCDGEDFDTFTSPESSPEACSSASQRARLVRRTVALLPPEQRQCIYLAFFQGLTQSEIASQTTIPLGTVKTRIRSGLMRLRKELHAIARASQRSH
jgi:RNA polymerase sigma-70 factor (ECF subfamily)